MNVPAIPDHISPIVGHRVWKWDANELWSLNGEAWLPGRALTAKCRKTDHEPPVDDCSCGVYAAKNYQHLQEIFHGVEYGLHGEVYLWGKIVEHDLGYRSQFAYPKSLVLPSIINPRLKSFRLKSLMVYGADISLPPNILLWTKGSGYTLAGSALLMLRGKPCGKWCNQWHERTLQMGECVTVLGRGIGLVERDDGTSKCTSDSVCIRLLNNDLYIVPHQHIVWNCQNWRWEVDLSGYKDTVILWSSKGWKILCRPLELMANYSDADKLEAQNKLYRAWEYLDRRNRRKLSSEFAQADADAQSIINAARETLFRALSPGLREELMYRSLPRGEDR